MAKYVDYKKMEQQLLQRTEGYASNVRAIYEQYFTEIINLVKGTELEDGVPFSFSEYGYGEEVNSILRKMYSRVYQVIRGGVEKEWLTANENNDELVKAVFGESSIEDNHFARFFKRNKEAMDAFFARKNSDHGLNLSQKVWNYTGQFKEELENTLDLAIGEGTGANRIATRVKQYLNEPDKWYRRFRYKKGEDADGNPVYGLKWKRRVWDKESEGYKWVDDEPKDYRPGRGVYRSSARNAQRLARTETNMAYRTADFERWQQLDFVVGIEIKLSNNHTTKDSKGNIVRLYDVCDDLAGIYPKTFKWRGWHPHCRCYQVPVLAKDDEMDEMLDAILDGKNPASVPCEGKVRQLPSQFTEWLERNEERMNDARERGTLPYFIRDNERLLNPPTAKEIAKRRHEARTKEQADAIKRSWWERRAVYHFGNNVLNIMGGIADVDTLALQEALRHPDLEAIKTEANKLKAIGKKIYSLSNIENPMEVAKKFSMADAVNVDKAVASKLKSMLTGDLSSQLHTLDFEIEWVTDHKKYSTWEVAANAYKKAKKEVEHQIEKNAIIARKATIEDFLSENPKNKKVKLIYNQALECLSKDDLKNASSLMDKAYDEMNAFIAKKSKDSAKGLAKIPKELEDYIRKNYTTDFTVTSQDSYEEVMRMLGDVTKEPWRNATNEQREAFPTYTNSSAVSYRVLSNVGLGKYEPLSEKMDAILDKIKTTKDLVLRSGQDYDVAGYVFGEDFMKILQSGNLDELNRKYGGTVGLNKAYMSTSFNEKGGFTKEFEVHIFAPKGTHLMNLNELSGFGHNKGSSWDGDSFYPYWSPTGETEIFLHRGYKWKFIKAEAGAGKGGTNRIYVQLLDRVK